MIDGNTLMVSAGGFLLAFITALFTAHAYFMARINAVRDALEAAERARAGEFTAVRKELSLSVEQVKEAEAKARSELGGGIQAQLGKIEMVIDQLRRETVRREEMRDLKNDLQTQLAKLEGKVDRSLEALARLAGLEAILQGLQARVEKALERQPATDGT